MATTTRRSGAGEDHELATAAPLRALIPNFAALLRAPADLATTARIERAPSIGRPLGAPEWIAMLERRLGRPLAPGKPGRKQDRNATLQNGLPGETNRRNG
jgi:hypothetical protein